jgi:alpha-galactosidase
MASLFKFTLSFILLLASIFTSRSASPEVKNKTDFRQWAPTPPMGWNSWDCFGPTVTEAEVKANADYMSKNLKKFGWEYIVVDIRWFVENDKAGGYNQKDPVYAMDGYGRYLPALNKFPSAGNGKGFKELAGYIHKLGLRFGIHLMRGIPKQAVEKKLPVKGAHGITADMIYTRAGLCSWLNDNYTVVAEKPGAQEYYNSIFELYASWGVDFVKVDDLSQPYHQGEIELIRKAIDRTGRPIILSTSPGATPIGMAKHISTHANMWRMVNDVWDEWHYIPNLMEVASVWTDSILPGTWPDCDMIPLGRIAVRGERGEERMTRLTKDEQYTLMTLFTICRSPLMFGGDMPQNDPFTNSLLTNAEVLKMHRESTGNRQVSRTKDVVIWTAENHLTGDIYLAMFNISDNKIPIKVKVDLKAIGVTEKCKVVDIWADKEMGFASEEFEQKLNPHACGLYKIMRQK